MKGAKKINEQEVSIHESGSAHCVRSRIRGWKSIKF